MLTVVKEEVLIIDGTGVKMKVFTLSDGQRVIEEHSIRSVLEFLNMSVREPRHEHQIN